MGAVTFDPDFRSRIDRLVPRVARLVGLGRPATSILYNLPRRVIPVGPADSAFLVPSKSSAGGTKTYLVLLHYNDSGDGDDILECSCRAGEEGLDCVHKAAVILYLSGSKLDRLEQSEAVRDALDLIGESL
jgi:hypothetical protein